MDNRLTVKSEIIDGYILKCMCGFGRDGVPDDEDSCRDVCNGNCDECGIQQSFNKLASYENTNLSPEEITAMKADNERLHKLVDTTQKLLWSDTEGDEE